jgi:hypothetical protein
MNFEIDPETKDWIDDGEGGFVIAEDARNDVYTQLAQTLGWWGDDTGIEKMPRVTEADVQRIEDAYMRALQRLIDDGKILDRVEFERATERDKLFQSITVYDARTGQALDVTQLQALQFRTNRIVPAPAEPVTPPAPAIDFSGTSAPAEVDTYSRGSVTAPRTAVGAGGDEVIKFASGVYAYAWSASLARIGASVPPAGTNLIRRSEDIGNSDWILTGGTKVASTYDDPEGDSLDAHQVNINNGEVLANVAIGNIIAGDYTAAIWLRGDVGGEQVRLRLQDQSGADQTDEDVTLTAQWQRYTVTSNLTDTSRRPLLHIRADFGAVSIGVWGGQIEQGSRATAYIPTAGATAARAATQIDFTLDSVAGTITNTSGTPEVSAGFTIAESDGDIVTEVQAAA